MLLKGSKVTIVRIDGCHTCKEEKDVTAALCEIAALYGDRLHQISSDCDQAHETITIRRVRKSRAR